MNPRLSSRFVLTDSEARLVRLLATFPESLEKAWDVPRSISLPGLAEHLGLVRSALNPPITSLENRGFIKTRQTHVIGGGHRKRTVVHLTKKGWETAEGLVPEEEVDSIGELFGNPPPLTYLHGRSEFVQEILEELGNDEQIPTLLKSIKRSGIRNPIWLKDLNDGKYLVIEGNRRTY
ncbi:MAG: ParB N-terminal domain-containing protein, partial [Candidatus Thalassarchaeaceae archaeon]|nr:ParB N-terminal domain-containing protein [Candidatus Thalassarchaeaceae archaeon]